MIIIKCNIIIQHFLCVVVDMMMMMMKTKNHLHYSLFMSYFYCCDNNT